MGDPARSKEVVGGLATTSLAATAPSETRPSDDEPSWGLRHAVVCLVLVALCFDQAPGRIVPDTKLDLVVAPWRFLGRALHMWNPLSTGGVVQNQANGYLWPMGPFFGVLHSLGLPAWVVQRSWWSLILVLAFLGTVRLARALGIGSDTTRLVAGVAFALSPRMLASLGPISVEVLPMAMSPWVVLPLVGAGGARSARRAAVLSALAVMCIGGVNAAATLGGVLPAALFLLFGPVVCSRYRLAAWWAIAVGLATAWWVLPLLLLGRYAAPFLPYTETSDVTTSVTNLVEVLRGTSSWVPYLYGVEGPLRPAGWDLLTSGPVVLASCLVVAAGLAGVASRRAGARNWLVGSLLVGVLLVSAGHVGAWDSPFSGPVRDALEGALSPLRNVHKFDPLVRLPLVLGLAHLLAGLRWRRDPSLTPAVRGMATAAVGVAVVVGLLPAVTAGIPAGKSFSRVPSAWSEVAGALAQQASSGRALLLPGSPFAQYSWGDPQDEPLQPLATSAWEVRDVSPLVPAGHVRLLDAIDQQLRSGQPSSGLAAVLARSGISHVVVRDDLRPVTAAVPAAVVRSVLQSSPGFSLVHSFGPAIQLYRVDLPTAAVTATPLSQVTLLRGGPESLLPAAEDDLVAEGPTVLAAQLPSGLRTGRSLLTDGLQRREEEFGSAEHLVSPVLGPRDPLVFDRSVREYNVGTRHDETVAELLGASAVRASSSLADPDTGALWSPSHLAYAAFDGNPLTSWTGGRRPLGPVGQWLELDLERPVSAASVRIVWGKGAVVRRVRVDTGSGSVQQLVTGTGTEELRLPAGPADKVRVTVQALDPSAPPGQVSIAELEVPGVRVVRGLTVPSLPGAATPDVVQLHASRAGQNACVATESVVTCEPSRVRHGDEEGGLVRRIDVGEGGSYEATAVVVPQAGPKLDALLDAQSPAVRVLATSSAVDEPLGGPAAALDGDTGSSWIASPADSKPGLVLGWLRPLKVGSLRLILDNGLNAARATRVRVHSGSTSYEADVADDGTVRFPPLTTTQLAVDLLFPHRSNPVAHLGVGVSEIQVEGLQGLAVPAPSTVVRLMCGTTPALAVAGRGIPTEGTTTISDLRALRPIRLTPCGSGTAPLQISGDVRLLAVSTPELRVDRVDLRRVGAPTAQVEPLNVRRLSWGDEHRRIQLPARSEPVLLAVRENLNDGWSGTADGDALTSVPVDGWQQGWLVPAGPATVVDLRFGPGRGYRSALALGAVGVLALLALLVIPSRPGPAPAPGRRRRSRTLRGPLATAGVAVGMVLLAGPIGLLAWLLAVGARTWDRQRRSNLTAWGTGLAYGPAGLLLALRPWGSSAYAGGSRLVTALCLLALAGATAVLPEPVVADPSPDAPAADG